MAVSVQDDSEHSRYELRVDEMVVGVVDYVLNGSTIVFSHTEVEPDRRGQGLAGILVRAALEDARDQGRSVVAQCEYVRDFIEANPEYRRLLAP